MSASTSAVTISRQFGKLIGHSPCTRASSGDGMPSAKVVQGEKSMRKLLWSAVAAVALLGAGVADAQQAQTPRKGGTIRMTGPYGASIGSLDPHVTPRAQDWIVNQAINRPLYMWDTANNKLALELATDVK